MCLIKDTAERPTIAAMVASKFIKTCEKSKQGDILNVLRFTNTIELNLKSGKYYGKYLLRMKENNNTKTCFILTLKLFLRQISTQDKSKIKTNTLQQWAMGLN